MITTQGFRISNLPRYTAPDPGLVGFNPAQIGAGALQTAQLVQMIEKVRADRALQEELAATRANRIGAQNARDLSTIQIAPAQTGITLSKIAAEQGLLPKVTKFQEGKLDFDIASNLAGLGNVAPKAALERAQAEQGLRALTPVTNATIAGADLAVANAAVEKDLVGLKGLANAAHYTKAITEVEDAMKLRDQTVQLAQNKLQEAITNGASDAELNRMKIRAGIAQDEAQAAYYKAHGAALLKAAEQDKNPAQAISALSRAAEDIYVKAQLGPYLEERYKDDGVTLKNSFFGMGGPAAKNEVKEAALAQYRLFQKTAETKANQWAADMAKRDNTPAAAVVMPSSNLLPNPNGSIADTGTGTTSTRTPSSAAIDILRKNPSMAPLFDQTYGNGSAAKYLPAR